jgi:prolyl-tRNA synthetase
MKYSQIFIPTLRDAPRDADAVSAKLMIRSGMIRKLAAGLYEWLPLGLKVLKKVEKIVREEMDRIGGQEVWLPHIQPKELWEETGRWGVYGKELLRIKDRKGSEFCFAPTAEEVITDLIRRDVRSYRQLPIMCYQFGTKFRDEIRPRFGVMRAREFYMKDAYSFHADEKDAEAYYGKALQAYSNIFRRCGLNFRPVEAETGAIGGSFSHEFMVLADTGEEEIVSCPSCSYAANVERAECLPPEPKTSSEAPAPMEDVSTPGAFTVDDVAKLMNAPKEKFIKALFFMADGAPVVAFVRGDCALNEPKLMRAAGAKQLYKMSEEDYSKLAGCDVGFAGPQGLKERAKAHDARTRIFADHLLKTVVNGISGGNKKDVHAKNVNLGRDYEPDAFVDLRNALRGDLCPRCGKDGKKSELQFSRGIEVGHAFKLGTKYSASMKAHYLDEAGQSIPFVMGCYGIGVSRVVAAAIEQGHDDNGIRWSKEMAPFVAIVIPVKPEDSQTAQWTDAIVSELEQQGWDVLVDDRPERAGVKFKDADLIGIPLRITIGEKGIAQGTVELKLRSQSEVRHVPRENLLKEAKALLG